MKRVTVQIRGEISQALALAYIARWYDIHEIDPIKTPMTGVITFGGDVVCYKREARKGDCFVVFKEMEKELQAEPTGAEEDA